MGSDSSSHLNSELTAVKHWIFLALFGLSLLILLTAATGTLTHSTTATFTVGDFIIAATSPAAVTVGTSATSTIILTPLNGFTGTAALTDTIPTYLTCDAITPASIRDSGMASLSCSSTIAGTYAVTVTATSGSLSHSSTATFTVTDFTIAPPTPDFAVTPSPASVTIEAGNSGTSTITIAVSNGFTGTVALSATSSPTGPTTSFSTTTITGGSGTSVLTVSVVGETPAGSYTITVQGTSGTQSHTTQVSITVTSAPSTQPTANAPSILGLSPPGFYGLIGILIGMLIGAIVVAIRRRPHSRPGFQTETRKVAGPGCIPS